MPKLRKLELQGFKSFADSATFLYPTGITAVVGPNGSGKSNIADAIRWVLGEQRLTSIRGRTGEDMIFAGSPKRSRSGMARAAITFDNSDGWLPVDFAEVTVERRTYRDGTSDYILNGSKVRLMDLRDVLDLAGLGRDAYLVIGQGLVDQVLSLRPQERLALFEQAAGITPYRTRREDAVGRLDETRSNLQRVYDIVGEIEPRLRRLERQAARAEEHSRLDKELGSMLRVWYGYRWEKALSNLEQSRHRVAYREDKALDLLQQVDDLETQIASHRRRINERRGRLATVHRESSIQHDEAGTRQRELAVARERQRQLQERIEESEANLVPLRSALASERQELAALREQLDEAEAQLRRARTELSEAEEDYESLARRRHGVLRGQSEAQSKALETRHRLADRQSRLAQAEEQVVELGRQIADLESALAEGTARRRDQQREVEAARRALENAETDLIRAREAEADGARRLQETEDEAASVQQSLNAQEAELQRLTARLEALDRLHAEGAGMYAGVRNALQAAERGELSGLPGPVSALLRVPSRFERAVEAALGSQLQNIVAETWADAQSAVDWLKRQRAGRATFLPLDTLRPSPILELPETSGVIGVASELVDYDLAYRPAVLLLLGRTAIVGALDAARQLHRELHGGFRIVTLDGEIVRSSGSVTGGESRQSQGPGLLTRERERRELRRRVAGLKTTVSGLEEELQELRRRVSSQTELQDKLVAERQEAEAAVRERDRAVEETVRILERLIQEMQWREERIDATRQERERLKEARERLQAAKMEAGRTLAELEETLAALESEIEMLSDDELARTLADRRTRVAVLAQEHESLRVLLESREREIERLRRQIDGQEHRIRSLKGELTGLGDSLDTLAAAYEEARSEADGLAAQIPPLEAELAELESDLEKLERQEQTLRRVLREAEQRLSQAEVDAGRREDQLQNLRREIEETLDIVISNLPETISTQQPLPLDDIVCPLPSVADLPQGFDGQIRDLRTQLRRLEPVNPAAKAEYAELAERHHFLREQMDDLERASAHLREIIHELDDMMDTMFSTTFRSIASEFSRVFELLFSGGNAELELAQDDGNHVGVEISARPPGKRTSGLSMLSGGERSLTAVALIFSVMRVSPTPFCVLDEVDAMLDEANVGRFRRMLQELARETQFIIITHNRGTVEVADTIYGVSMGDDGVSEVLSLSLEDLPASEVV